MNISAFHQSWFGTNPPERFLITPQQVQLYEAFPKVRGFSCKLQSHDIFLSTFVLALAQTIPTSNRQVFFLTPQTHMKWSLNNIKDTVLHMLQCRKSSKVGTDIVKKTVHQITLLDKPHKINEPARWVSMGFCKEDQLLPEWLTDGLLLLND